MVLDGVGWFKCGLRMVVGVREWLWRGRRSRQPPAVLGRWDSGCLGHASIQSSGIALGLHLGGRIGKILARFGDDDL